MEWSCLKALPPGLSPGFASQPLKVGDVYSTTSQQAYRHRSKTTPSMHLHRRAPGHWKVHYTMYTLKKCEEKAWSPTLTMANQSSEMKSQYQARPDHIRTTLPESVHNEPLKHVLEDHHDNQRTKDLPPSTVNRAAEGRPVVASEGGLFHRLEPYLTTNHCFHRYFTPDEQRGYPRNDAATYWICENYPKSWGYGMDCNPLDAEDVERPENKEAMRDRMVFTKTATTLPKLDCYTNKPIASGLHSQYWDDYTAPSPSKTRELFHCPVPAHAAPSQKDTTQMRSVPHMYKSMNRSYGSLPPAVKPADSIQD